MSYCRWSSDDFQCDVYCYEADEGFIIHVAVSRPVLKDGDLPPRIPFQVQIPDNPDDLMDDHVQNNLHRLELLGAESVRSATTRLARILAGDVPTVKELQ